jgi:hypothetical protein
LKAKTPLRRASPAGRLEPLENIFIKLNPEAEPGDLAAEMVRLLAAPGCVEGARIWKLVDGIPAVWQESGKLPAASPHHVEQILAGKPAQGANGHAKAWALGRGTTPVGVLEIAPKSKLDERTRAWLELFLRYAEVALESSERRSAVIELSTIVEATKRLNSTLDLAELLNITWGPTTRHSGAEPGAVTASRGAMKELVEAIAKALVDYPNHVHVRAIEGEQVTVFELRVDPSDVRRVIGRQGRNVNAIRTILNAVGVKLRRRYTLEILE